MPVLIIAVAFLILFLIMGIMGITAVASERRLQREVEEYERAAGHSTDAVAANSAAAGR